MRYLAIHCPLTSCCSMVCPPSSMKISIVGCVALNSRQNSRLACPPHTIKPITTCIPYITQSSSPFLTITDTGITPTTPSSATKAHEGYGGRVSSSEEARRVLTYLIPNHDLHAGPLHLLRQGVDVHADVPSFRHNTEKKGLDRTEKVENQSLAPRY